MARINTDYIRLHIETQKQASEIYNLERETKEKKIKEVERETLPWREWITA